MIVRCPICGKEFDTPINTMVVEGFKLGELIMFEDESLMEKHLLQHSKSELASHIIMTEGWH